MLHVTAILLTVLTTLALLLRWDYDRKRLVWFWRSNRRRRQWIGRGLLLAVLAMVSVGPIIATPSAEAQIFFPPGVPNPMMTCPGAPMVDRPGMGFAGALDPGSAEPGAQGSPRTPYGEYGYGGQTWHVYDIGCAAQYVSPAVDGLNTVGNFFFNIAKGHAAMTNGLNYVLLDPSSFDWLNTLVRAISGSLFDGVFGVWVQLALFILAAILLWHGKTGDNAGAAKRLTWAALGFWLAASAALLPVTYNDFFRGHLVALTGAAQSGFVDPTQPDSKHAMPDVISRVVVYNNWLTGQFGDAGSENAKKYGMAILDAKSCSKVEVRENRCDPKAKQAAYYVLAQEIKNSGQGYEVFTGAEGWPRISAGAIALFQSSYILLYQLISKLIIMMSFVMIAILIFLLPITGLLGMINPDTLRGNLKAFGMAFVNALMMGLTGGLHTRLVEWGQNLPFLLQSVFLLLVTILLLVITRPIKRLKAMLSATMEVANASFPESFRHKRYPRYPRASERYFQKQREDPDGFLHGNPGKRGFKWTDISRGTPEERSAAGAGAGGGGGLMPTLGKIYGGTVGAEEAGGGKIWAAATRLGRDAVIASATGGGSAAGQMAARAMVGGGGSTGEIIGNVARTALPSGGDSNSSESRTGTVSPVREPRRTGENKPSSLGMIDDEPDYYRPSVVEAENVVDDRPVFDAQQDASGTWYVPSDQDTRGNQG